MVPLVVPVRAARVGLVGAARAMVQVWAARLGTWAATPVEFLQSVKLAGLAVAAAEIRPVRAMAVVALALFPPATPGQAMEPVAAVPQVCSVVVAMAARLEAPGVLRPSASAAVAVAVARMLRAARAQTVLRSYDGKTCEI